MCPASARPAHKRLHGFKPRPHPHSSFAGRRDVRKSQRHCESVRASALGAIGKAELTELILDGWLFRASKRRAELWLTEQDT